MVQLISLNQRRCGNVMISSRISYLCHPINKKIIIGLVPAGENNCLKQRRCRSTINKLGQWVNFLLILVKIWYCRRLASSSALMNFKHAFIKSYMKLVTFKLFKCSKTFSSLVSPMPDAKLTDFTSQWYSICYSKDNLINSKFTGVIFQLISLREVS